MNLILIMKQILSFLFLFVTFAIFSQNPKYTFVHFEDMFAEGIYVTFNDFKQQKPIKKEQIIAMEDPNDPQFLLKVLSYERFSYFDSIGNKLIIESPDIWGLVRRNSLYVFHDFMLAKVHFNGRWGYFTTYELLPQPEMGVMPGSYYAVQVPITAGKKTITKIIDFKTGEIQEFSRKNLKKVLAADSLILNEYNSLRRRKQKQLKYLYLRKINDRFYDEFNLKRYQ
jgi:hypothetical protein